MLLFVPTGTDAPVYHFPYVTIGLIVVNTLVFAATGVVRDADWEMALALERGAGLYPYQWITSNFLHADLMHLIGNMLFLWLFGLVVEGKLGAWRFLAVYLTIGFVQSGLEQSISLFTAEGGYSLGASAIIYGLLAISALWAPVNCIEFTVSVWLFPIFRAATYDVPIWLFALAYVLLDGFFAYLTGFALVTPTLHVMGALVGLPIGIVLLSRGVVDCENWDAWSVWKGDYGPWAKQDEPEIEPAEDAEQREQRIEATAATETEKLRSLLSQKQGRLALFVHQRAAKTLPAWRLERDDLLRLVQTLHADKLYAESVPLMVEYVRRFPDKSIRVRLGLAQILIQRQRRPGQALAVLAKIPQEGLSPELRKVRGKLVRHAQQMRASQEAIELAPEDW